MSNPHLNHLALEQCLRTLNHLFIDITRLTYEQGYEEITGGYCELKVATLDSGIPTAKLVAAKRLRLGVRATEPKRLAFRLARELKVWAGLQHPHILPLLGFYVGDDYKSAVLISEYMDHGDLKNYIAKVKPSLDERVSLVRDLTDGLTYLHTQSVPIRHGDLKPGNVLVNPHRRALLADFGLSKALDTGSTGFTTGNEARCTVRYSSPEVLLQGTVAESLPNDIWSWGCLVLEALTDKIPFASIQPEPQLIIALVQGKSPSDETDYSLLPTQLVDLLAKCWSREPNDRPTAARCLVIVHSLPSSPPALPQCQHYTPPGVTSPQNGALWTELQQRYVKQVQHAQELNQNATKMPDGLQQPHQQGDSQLDRLGNETHLNTQQFLLGLQAGAAAGAAVAAVRQNQQDGTSPYNRTTGQVPPHTNNQLAALSRTKPNTHIFGSGPNVQQQGGVPGLPGLGLANGAGGNGGGAGGPVEALQNQNQNQNPNLLLQIAAQRLTGITPQQFANMTPQQREQLRQILEKQQQQQQQQQASQQQQQQQNTVQGNGPDGAAFLEQIVKLPIEAFRNQLVNFKNKIRALEDQRDMFLQFQTPQTFEQAQKLQAQINELQNIMQQLTEAYQRRQAVAMGLQPPAAGPSGQQGGQPPTMGPPGIGNSGGVQNRPRMGGQGPQDGLGGGSAQLPLGWPPNITPQMAQQLSRERPQAMARAAAVQQQQQQEPQQQSSPASPRVPSIQLQVSPQASRQPRSKQTDPTGVSHRTGVERSSLKRKTEDDEADHKGSPGLSSSSKRARKASRRL